MKKYSVWFTINRACNLRCKWCYAQSTGFETKKEMSLELLDRLIDIVREFSLKNIILIGGEPTIHKDFFSILDRVNQLGVNVGVVTNGIRFSDLNFLTECYEHGMDSTTISLKAPTDDLYKQWTGVKALDKVSMAIENFHKLKKDFLVSLVLSEGVYRNIEDFIYFLKEMNITRVFLDTERPVLLNNQPVYAPLLDEIISGYNRVYDLFKKNEIKFIFKLSTPFCLLPKDILKKMKANGNIQSSCSVIGDTGLPFDTNGDLLVCNTVCSNPIAKYGIDFKTGLELKQYKEKNNVKSFYDKMASYPDKKCIDCPEWVFCGGGCRIFWLYENPLLGKGVK